MLLAFASPSVFLISYIVNALHGDTSLSGHGPVRICSASILDRFRISIIESNE
jgi:hypothetical protein